MKRYKIKVSVLNEAVIKAMAGDWEENGNIISKTLDPLLNAWDYELEFNDDTNFFYEVLYLASQME